jgi:hypothetical protein
MVGIIYYNSFAGRSGEWQAMLGGHVLGQIQAGKDFLLCHQHKTADTYGALAKYVPPGSMDAMHVYLQLPGKESVLFLEPANPDSKCVSVSQHLHRFGTIYLPGHVPANCNLIRKQFHTMLLRSCREGSCMELLSKVDAHSAEVAKKVYCTTTAADDAKLGKFLYESLFGSPVMWPSEEAIAAKLNSPSENMAMMQQIVLWQEGDHIHTDDEHSDEEREDVIEKEMFEDKQLALMDHSIVPLIDASPLGSSSSSSSSSSLQVAMPIGGSSSSAGAAKPVQREGKQEEKDKNGKQDKNDTKKQKKTEKKDKKEKHEKKDNKEQEEKGDRHTTPENLRAFFAKRQKDKAPMVEPAAVPSIKVEPAAMPSKGLGTPVVAPAAPAGEGFRV